MPATFDQDVIAQGLGFPEGPATTDSGSIYFVEMASQRVSEVAPDGGVRVLAETPGGPNGLAVSRSGQIVICNNGGQWPFPSVPSTEGLRKPPAGQSALQLVSLEGEVTTVLTEVEGQTLSAANDLCADAEGGFYFTDPVGSSDEGELPTGATTGRICYLAPNGDANVVADGIPFPNGIALVDGGTRLLASDSAEGLVRSWSIAAPGRTDDVHGQLNGSVGRLSAPDGICVDEERSLLIVAAYLRNALYVFSLEDGRPVTHIELRSTGPTNATVDQARDRLVVTCGASGDLLAVEWPGPAG